MSKNKAVRILQTIIIVLIGLVSPSFAQTFFIDKKKEISVYACNINYIGYIIVMNQLQKHEETDRDEFIQWHLKAGYDSVMNSIEQKLFNQAVFEGFIIPTDIEYQV